MNKIIEFKRQSLSNYINFIIKPMEPSKQNSNRSVINKHIKVSSLVNEVQDERANGFSKLQQFRKEMSDSSFLDMHDNHTLYTSTIVNDPVKRSQVTPRNQEANPTLLKLMRARSLKNINDTKPTIQAADKTSNDLTQNIVRLKVQQMTFKYKTKIGCLLKQINISGEQMNKFNKIAKTEEIINFLSEKVRDKIVKLQVNETNFLKAKSNQIQANNEYEIERQLLKKKLQQKQSIQRELKIKIKESNAQTKDLLNQLSQKEQELSLRMDQLYQQKTLLSEQQKLIARLQQTCNSLQKMNVKSINKLSTQSNDMIILNKQLQEQNTSLSQTMKQIKDQIQQYKEKQAKLIQINKQLNDQITRWRQRYQDGLSIQLEQLNNNDGNLPMTPNLSFPEVKKRNSSMSVGNSAFGHFQAGNAKKFSSTPLQIQNMRLLTKIQELQKKNKQLSRDILNYSTIKQKYQQKLTQMGEKKYNYSQGMEGNKNQYIEQKQLQNHYKQKIEEVIKEWKQKLYEIVNKYQDELQLTRDQVSKLKMQKVDMQKKIYVLANQRCIFQTKLIQKDREMYQFKMSINTNSPYSPIKKIKDDTISNSIIMTEQQTQKMIISQSKTTVQTNSSIKKTENFEAEKTPEIVTHENSS